MLRLLLIHGLTLPDSYLLVLAYGGYHVAHQADVAAPCDVANPILMRLLDLISHVQLIDNFKFLISWVLSPNLYCFIHTTRNKSSWSHVHFIFCVLL